MSTGDQDAAGRGGRVLNFQSDEDDHGEEAAGDQENINYDDHELSRLWFHEMNALSNCRTTNFSHGEPATHDELLPCEYFQVSNAAACGEANINPLLQPATDHLVNNAVFEMGQISSTTVAKPKRKRDYYGSVEVMQIGARDQNDDEEIGEDKEMNEGRLCKIQPKRAARSSSTQVHNLNERLRRQKIKDKMKALQDLIPNCNKRDKASTLDDAIKYIKALQYQLQMMSMGAGDAMYNSPNNTYHQQLPLPSTVVHDHQFPTSNFPPPFLQTMGLQGMQTSHYQYLGLHTTSPSSTATSSADPSVLEYSCDLTKLLMPSCFSTATTTSSKSSHGALGISSTDQLGTVLYILRRSPTAARVLPSQLILPPPHHETTHEDHGSTLHPAPGSTY